MRQKVKQHKVNPTTKEILTLLGLGTLLTASLVFPGLGYAFNKLQQASARRHDQWDKYNLWRLRWTVKRLQQQQMVEVRDGKVILTQKGKQKVLYFQIADMHLIEKFDGNWRLIIYDIADLKKTQRELFRLMLKKLRCLKLQRSVYVTPFPCEDHIEFLKNHFGVREEVLLVKTPHIEDEAALKAYFGI